MSPMWTNPDGSRIFVPDSAEPTSKLPTPDVVRQFLREIGRRGGRERSRNHARRTPRGWIRFQRRYQCDPNQVQAATVSASLDVWHYLRAFASRGGQERAERYPKETLRAWAAMGGHAKAAKSKQASSVPSL